MPSDKGQLLYQGKAKSLYETQNSEYLLCEFRDDTTAFDGEKKASLVKKGGINQKISAYIFSKLSKAGLPTHWIKSIDATHMLVKRLQMIPIECVVRNRAAGSLCRRLGIDFGLVLTPPLFELFLKSDTLHDPLITEDHVLQFSWANRDQLRRMRALTLEVNTVLSDLFLQAGMILVDAKFEFGIDEQGSICLGDEVSPDSCRIWEVATLRPLDKDRFRQDLGEVIESYQIVADRLGVC